MAQSGMELLKVSPEKLQNKAEEFGDCGKEFKSITEEMFQIIKQLTGVVWSGAAAEAYTNNFNELQNDCTRMFEMITEFTDDLKEIAAEYISAETANEEVGLSLKTDVIV